VAWSSIERPTRMGPTDSDLMKHSASLSRFGALLEKHLPPISELHQAMHEMGFAAWRPFMEERVALVSAHERIEELDLLFLCCREEFGNFTRYTRETAGDGLKLPKLAAHRQLGRFASSQRTNRVLASDAYMLADRGLAVRYAAATRQLAIVALEAERRRFITNNRIEAVRSSSLSDLVRSTVAKRFDAVGFASRLATTANACFQKSITQSAQVVACIDDIDKVAADGWRGEVCLSFYICPSPLLEEHYVETCCKGQLALPLRLGGLVPGIHAYKTGACFLASSLDSVSGGDIVTLTAYSNSFASEEERLHAVAHVGLAVSCFLTLFALVEPVLRAAVLEFENENLARN
jgi:hypothetical protein